MLIQPSREMKTDSLISLNTIIKKDVSSIDWCGAEGVVAWLECNSLYQRKIILKRVLARFYTEKLGGTLLRKHFWIYFASFSGPSLYSSLKWLDLFTTV